MLVGHEQSQLESSNMEICWQKKLTAETPHFRLLYYNNVFCHMNNYYHYYYALLSMTKTKLTSKTLYFETLKQNLTYYAFSPTK